MAKIATLTITQIRSEIGRLGRHRACLTGLGLRRIGHTVTVEDTPSVRGMINKVSYMLKIEDN
ncbi:MAG: 50S ribosomal protein L30 [Porticoccaceae bacterium]|nr:50S ribosomal protein L30 [Porticoccaceae bacterium]